MTLTRDLRVIAGRMLLGLGQITQKEVDRHGEAAMTIGKSSFKYAWCCDTTQVERERGVSTSLSHHLPPFELTLTRSQRVLCCAVLRDAWCSNRMEG
jgi:translation elongation factor EF-1alpha